jgi:O-antigen ligase
MWPRPMTASPSTLPRGRFEGALLWLPIVGVALGQRFVLPGASLADLALGLFAAAAFVLLARESRRSGWPPLPAWTMWLGALWAWAALGGLAHVILDTEVFSLREFLKSFAKLSFYAAAAPLLVLALRRSDAARTADIVLNAFGLAGALAIAIYVAMLAGVPLPYQALWGHGPELAYFKEVRWFAGVASRGPLLLRAQGLAAEPSRLGYLQSMALGYVLLRPGSGTRIDLRLVVVILSILLSFSLTGYALLLSILGLWLLPRWRRARLAPGRRGLVAAASVLVVLLPLAPTLYRAVVVRASHSFSGSGDASARMRVVGNWQMTYRLLEENPVLGVGLGNYDVMAGELQAFLFEGHFSVVNSQGWNAFAYVLATLGVPGLLLFLALLVSAFRGRGRLALPFVLGMFADGTVLGAAFWVFFTLYTTADSSS